MNDNIHTADYGENDLRNNIVKITFRPILRAIEKLTAN